MAKKDAEITVGANADEVKKVADAVKHTWQEVGQILKGVGTQLASVATAAGQVNFSSQHQQVRDFESVTSRLAVSTGQSLGQVRSQFENIGVAIGKRPSEVAAWTSEVGKLTYNFDGARDSIQAVNGLAAQTGRSVDDYRGLAAGLGQMGVKGKDTAAVLGTLAAQADELGTAGGVAALADQFAAASEAATQFSDRGIDGVKRLTGFIGMLGKGLDAVSAQRVGQQALGALAADPRGWERYLGRHIIDDKTGKIEDPATVYKDIYKKTARRFKDPETLRAVMLNNFGPELGTALMRAGKSGNFDQVSALASMTPSSKPTNAASQLLNTDAGKRSVADAELSKASRDLMGSSTLLGKAADSLQRFSSHNPITGTIVASALSAGAAGAMGKIGGSMTSLLKAALGARGLDAGAIAPLAGRASGLLAKAGWVGAAGAAGYALGTAADEAFGISDAISGTGSHSRIKSSEDKKDVSADAALQKRLDVIRAENAKSKTARDMASGIISFDPMQIAQAGGMTQSSQDAGRQLEASIMRGMAGVKINIINSTGGPIDATNQMGQSAAAGNQSR